MRRERLKDLHDIFVKFDERYEVDEKGSIYYDGAILYNAQRRELTMKRKSGFNQAVSVGLVQEMALIHGVFGRTTIHQIAERFNVSEDEMYDLYNEFREATYRFEIRKRKDSGVTWKIDDEEEDAFIRFLDEKGML